MNVQEYKPSGQWRWKAFQAVVWVGVTVLLIHNGGEASQYPVFIGGFCAYFATGFAQLFIYLFLRMLGRIPKAPKQGHVGQLDAFAREVGLLNNSEQASTSTQRR